MLNKTLLLILFLSAPVFLSAQNAYYQKGYIIKNNGDTLVGYLQRLNDIDLSKEVSFKEALTNDSGKVFYPTGLRGFYFEEDRIKYESLAILFDFTDEIKTENRFAVQMLSGYCSLYTLNLAGEKPAIFEGTSIYIAKKGDTLTRLYETENLDGDQYTLTKNYIDSLSLLFKDCSAINYGTIAKANFSSRGMMQLFTMYNSCINSGIKTSVQNFESPTQIRHGIEVSYVSYYAPGIIGTPRDFSIGYFMDFLKPSISENVSFTIGLNYLRLTTQQPSYPDSTQSFTENIVRFHFLSAINLTNKKAVIPFINFGGTSMYDFNNAPNLRVYPSAGAGCFIGKKIMAAFLLDDLFFRGNVVRFTTFRIGYRFK